MSVSELADHGDFIGETFIKNYFKMSHYDITGPFFYSFVGSQIYMLIIISTSSP